MADYDKPFACNVDGCGMHFANEDHLTVHKRRHQMHLNLVDSGHRNTFAADQTPTPTRFIKIGEEFGLFTDLPGVNPFDEQFRKASQSSEKGQITIPEASSLLAPLSDSDSLNTPSIPVTVVENDLTVTTTSADPPDVITSDDGSSLLPDSTPTELREPMTFPSGSLPSSTTVDSEDDSIEAVRSSLDKSSPSSPLNHVTSTLVSLPSNTCSTIQTPVSVTGNPCTVVQTPVIASVGSTNQTSWKSSISGVPTAVVTRAVSSNGVTLSTPVAQITEASNSNASTAPSTVVQPVAGVYQLVLKLPNGQTAPAQIPVAFAANPVITTQPVTSSIVAVAAKPVTLQNQSVAKLKLKETLQSHRNITVTAASTAASQPATTITTVQSGMPSIQTVSASDVSQSTPTVNGVSSFRNCGSKRRKGFDDDPDERRKKFLERNRAAANRCRQRRKLWIQNLEGNAKKLQETNNQLQHEVAMLRNEVAQLKTMLLAHKDCPITLQQRAARQPEMPAITTISFGGSGASVVQETPSTAAASPEASLPLAVELVEVEVTSSQNGSVDGSRQSLANGE